MKRIVITGATSFIGVHLIQEWLKRDCQIYAVVRPNSRNTDRLLVNERLTVVELNMTDYDQIPKLIGSADVFYHLAWEGARIPHRDNPVMQEKNYSCAVAAMKAAQQMGCSLFVGAGSQAEYGKMVGSVNEDYPCNPTTEYGKAKLKAGIILEKMAKSCNMRFIWLRIFSIYGKYDYNGTLIMSCVDKMKRNEPLQLTECSQKWDYLYVEDVANAMVLFSEVPCKTGVYNIASGHARPLKEFVEIIKEISESKSTVDYGAIPYGPDGPVNLEPDVGKISSHLCWHAKTDFRTGVQSLL